MLLAAIYMAMLLTNWGNPIGSYNGVKSTATFFPAGGNASFWMQYTAQWCSMGIYLFSLLAPLIFPDRTF
jgi:hypothetical protein